MNIDAITITADKGTPEARVLASDLASARDGLVVVSDTVRITWSRPAGILPPEPTDCQFTLWKPHDHTWPDVDVDTRITVAWTVGGVEVVVFDGYVDTVTSHPATRGETYGRRWHGVTVNAICPIGRYSRVRFGEEPWPIEHSNTRKGRFDALLPGWTAPTLTEINPVPNTDRRYTLAARVDVDSRSPIEVAQELLNAHRAVLIAGTSTGTPTVTGVRMARRTLGAIVFANGVATYRPASGQIATVELPAWAVDNTDKVKSFDSSISSVTVRYALGMMDIPDVKVRDVSKTWGDSAAPGARISIDTQTVSVQYLPVPYSDEQFEKLQPEPPLNDTFWSSLIQPNNRRVVRLGTLRIPLDRLGDEHGPALRTLTDLTGRWGTAVYFNGITPDVSPVQVPIGGTLTLSGDPSLCELSLTVEPFELSADGPVEWQEFGIPSATVRLYQSDFTFHESAYASEVI